MFLKRNLHRKDRYSGESDCNVFTVDTVGNVGTSATDKILLGLHKGGAMSSGDYMVENNEDCHTKFSVYKNNSDISRIQYYLRRVNGLDVSNQQQKGQRRTVYSLQL